MKSQRIFSPCPVPPSAVSLTLPVWCLLLSPSCVLPGPERILVCLLQPQLIQAPRQAKALPHLALCKQVGCRHHQLTCKEPSSTIPQRRLLVPGPGGHPTSKSAAACIQELSWLSPRSSLSLIRAAVKEARSRACLSMPLRTALKLRLYH